LGPDVHRSGHRHLHARQRAQAVAMKILICSDGTSSAETATHFAGLLAGPLNAQTTLLGIAETSGDEQPLRDTLNTEAQSLRQRDVSPNVIVQSGPPDWQMATQTTENKYNLAATGAR